MENITNNTSINFIEIKRGSSKVTEFTMTAGDFINLMVDRAMSEQEWVDNIDNMTVEQTLEEAIRNEEDNNASSITWKVEV